MANNLAEDTIKLPISDWLLIIFYVLIFPLIWGLFIISLALLNDNDWFFFLILLVILIFFLLIIGNAYFKAYNQLKEFAFSVKYVHFQPSWRDLALVLIRYFYYVVIIGLILLLLLRPIIILKLSLWSYFALMLFASIAIQIYLMIRAMYAKIALLNTAREPISEEIINYINQNHPHSHLITQYRFADIQIPSLFLSAGVMTFGKSNIALISRYFNWKLSNEELIAVISHELGHLSHNHIIHSYIHEGLAVVLRSLRFFCILSGLMFSVENSSLVQLILSTDPLISLMYIILVLAVFLSSGMLGLFRQYRVLLAEIRADNYGAKLVGHEVLASTLRKLPDTIPSPISYNQSSFLGFRIALLRNQMNNKND
ncbi:MAG: M48 family metallopeptidase [Candidatus Hodarchaeota archaeon]